MPAMVHHVHAHRMSMPLMAHGGHLGHIVHIVHIVFAQARHSVHLGPGQLAPAVHTFHIAHIMAAHVMTHGLVLRTCVIHVLVMIHVLAHLNIIYCARQPVHVFLLLAYRTFLGPDNSEPGGAISSAAVRKRTLCHRLVDICQTMSSCYMEKAALQMATATMAATIDATQGTHEYHHFAEPL